MSQIAENPPARTRSALPLLAVAAALVSQNMGAAFAKSLFPLVGTEGVTALRVGLAACMLAAAARPWRRRIGRRDVGNLVVYGAMLGLMNLLIYRAFELIPIGIAIAIEVTGPLAVVLLSSRSPRDVLWVALAAAGLSMLLPIGAGTAALDPEGVAYAAGAALCWALYIVFGKRASSLGGGQAVAWGMAVASLFTVPLGVLHAGSALFAPGVLLAGLAVALMSSALPYSLEMAAMRRLPRPVFGILVSAAPAIGALAGFFVLDERLAWTQWAAIACIILACGGSAATDGAPRK